MKKIILILTLFLSGCLIQEQDFYEPQYVVESYLSGNDQFPSVHLTQTLPLDEFYSLDQASVQDAEVRIFEIDQNGNSVDTIFYSENINQRGEYLPIDTLITVKALTKYQLDITVPQDNNHKISAETIVPGAFTSVSATADTILYQNEEQFKVEFTPSIYPNREAYYIITLIAPDTNQVLTPFYENIADGDGPTRTELQTNSSGLLNEENFDIVNGNVISTLPWFAVAFYGDIFVETNAIDDNTFDFIRTKDTQFGGGNLSPGEIYDIIDHVEGGTGVFGSYYRVENLVYIKENPLLVFD